MDIVFTQKTQSCYREFADPVKRIQVSCESVVPDTNEDIGRIASIRSQILLKSKEVTSRGLSASGEVDTVLLYITEDEKAVSFLRLRRDFSLELEDGDWPLDTLAQLRLTVSNTEARILNPRKVAVTVELLAAFSCFCREELATETELPVQHAALLLHGRRESLEATPVNGVCEKTFVLSEQFRFPEGKPLPTQLVSQHIDFQIEDVQQIGSRAVVKGRVLLDVCWLAADRACPVQTRFTSLFSQIVDTGAEECVSPTAFAVPTGAYFDLTDTISGEKALEAEIHALLQLTSRCRREIGCLTDLYSNRYPVDCRFEERSAPEVGEEQRLTLRAEAELSVAEDCTELLGVFAAVTSVRLTEEGLPLLILGLDLLYRRQSGELSAVRRQMELSGENALQDARLGAGRVLRLDPRLEGGTLRCRAEAELSWQRDSLRKLRAVTGAALREEEPFDTTAMPSLTLVRPGSEELWELAKRCHGSVEAIERLRASLGTEGELIAIEREG